MVDANQPTFTAPAQRMWERIPPPSLVELSVPSLSFLPFELVPILPYPLKIRVFISI